MANYINHQQAKQGIESAIARRQYNNSLEGALNNRIQSTLAQRIGFDTLEKDQESIAKRLQDNAKRVEAGEYVDPKEYDALVADSESIGKRLGYYRNYIKNAAPDNADAIKSASEMSKAFLDASKAMGQQQSFFSNFKDADDYKTQMDAYKEQQRLTFDYDLNAGKSKLDSYKAAGADKKNAFKDEYEALKNEYELAKYYQTAYGYDKLTENEDFEKKSKKANSTWDVGETARAADYINGKWYAKAGDTISEIADTINIFGNNETVDAYNKYDFMTDDQVKTFNYIYNTQGQKKAQAYLDFIEGELAQKYAQKNKTSNFFVNALRAVNAGTESIGEGLENLALGTAKEGVNLFTGGKSGDLGKIIDNRIKENVAASNNALALAARQNEAGKLEKFAYDLMQTTPTTLVNMFLPGGLIVTSLSAAGNSYAEATADDKNSMQRIFMAIGEGSMEALTNLAQKQLGGEWLDGAVDTLTQNMSKTLGKSIAANFIRYGYHGISEGLEEAVQEIAGTFLRDAVEGKPANLGNIDWGNVGYSFLLGAASADMLQTPNLVTGIYNDIKLPAPNEATIKEMFDTAPKGASVTERFNALTGNLEIQDSLMSATAIANVIEGHNDKAIKLIDDQIATYKYAKEYAKQNMKVSSGYFDGQVSMLNTMKNLIESGKFNAEAARNATMQNNTLWQIAGETNDAVAKTMLDDALSNSKIEKNILTDKGTMNAFYRLTGTDLSQYKTVTQKRNAVKTVAEAYKAFAGSDAAKQVTEILKANNSQTDATIRSENRINAQKVLEEAYKLAANEDKQAREKGDIEGAKIAQAKMKLINHVKNDVRNGNALSFASLDGSAAVNNARKYTESAPKVEPKQAVASTTTAEQDRKDAFNSLSEDVKKILSRVGSTGTAVDGKTRTLSVSDVINLAAQDLNRRIDDAKKILSDKNASKEEKAEAKEIIKELKEELKKLNDFQKLHNQTQAEIDQQRIFENEVAIEGRIPAVKKFLKKYGLDLDLELGGVWYTDEEGNAISKEEGEKALARGEKVIRHTKNGYQKAWTAKVMSALAQGNIKVIEGNKMVTKRIGYGRGEVRPDQAVDIVIGHELVHFIKTNASNASAKNLYQDILKAIKGTTYDEENFDLAHKSGEKNADAQKNWDNLKKLYVNAVMESDKSLTREQAEAKVDEDYILEEIAADYMGALFRGQGIINTINMQSNFFVRIWEWLTKLSHRYSESGLDRQQRVDMLAKKLKTLSERTYGRQEKLTAKKAEVAAKDKETREAEMAERTARREQARAARDAQKSTQSEAKTEAEQTPAETEKRAENEERMMVVGESAETADFDMLDRAIEMIATGVDSETVRKETGWFKGYDDRWKYEIDDSVAEWHLDTAKPDPRRLFEFGERIFKLSDILDHKELYKAYPQLRDVTVWENPNASEGGYVVGRGTDSFVMKSLANTEINKDLIIHEIQHLVQNIEGFAQGASPSQFTYLEWGDTEYDAYEKRNEVAKKLYAILRRHGVSIKASDMRAVETAFEVNDGIIQDNYITISNLADSNPRTEALLDEYYKYRNILYRTTPHGQYMATAGEIEAYDTQARRRKDADYRKNTRPNIDRTDAIVRGVSNVTDTAKWMSAAASAKDSEVLSIIEQIKNSQDQLNAMDVVGSANAPTNMKTKSDAIEWALRSLKASGYQIDRQGYGVIRFDENDLKNGAKYADTPAEKAAFVLLPKVLKRGIEIGHHGNHKLRQKETITFAAPVELNGVRGNMAAVVNFNGNHYYAHRLILPDGTTFEFTDQNKKAKQELYQGVLENESLANTTSFASKGSISQPSQNVNSKFSLSEAESDGYIPPSDAVRFNVSAIPEHKANLEEKFTNDSAVDLGTLMNRYDKIIETWDRLGGELNSKFLNEWNEKKGKDRAFTIFKAQSGYKYNVELSSMCKKGVPLFEAIDYIVREELMKELNVNTLGKAEKEILYDILSDKGFDIPCAICYVEQARQREGDIINAFLNGNDKNKLGWNQTLDRVQAEMKQNGVEYEFKTADRSITTDKYTSEYEAMDEDTQNAFYSALQKLANEEITRYNEETKELKLKRKVRPLIKSVTPEAIKKSLGGNASANLKIFNVLFTEQNSRFKMDSDILYSSMTTSNLKGSHSKLYSLFNQQGGVSGYKTKQAPVIYIGDILNKKWKASDLRVTGGVRNQSNSDFQMYTLMDQAQMYIDFTAKGYYMQAYTKVLSELKLFGLSNSKINASLIPKVKVYYNADGTVDFDKTMDTAGLDEKGNPLYDDIEGINHDEAFMLISDPEYSKSIGGVCIGYSDKHIFKLLDDPKIQLIIGFHDKTNNPDERYRGARYAKNYNGENEAVKYNPDGTTETVHIGFNQFVQKAEKKFTFDEKTETYSGTTTFNGKTYTANDIPKLAADLYLDMCANKGYTPAYNTFKGHENYYKLLADFSLYDSQGNYAPHRKVAYNMPDQVPYLDNGKKKYMDTEAYIKGELEKEMKVRDDVSEALADKSEDGIIPQFIKRVNERDGKMSVTAEMDADYLSAVENGDMETAQRLVEEAARESGYTIKAYHGTPQMGFTVFDPKYSDDKLTLFFTDNPKVARTYAGDRAKVQTIESAKLGDKFKYERGKKYTEDEMREAHEFVQRFYHVYGIPTFNVEKQTMYHAGTRYSAKQILNLAERLARTGLYQVYVNPDEMMVIDAKDKGWHQLSDPDVVEYKYKINAKDANFNYFNAKASDEFTLELYKNGELEYKGNITFTNMIPMLRERLGEARAEMAVRNATDGSGYGSKDFATATSDNRGSYAKKDAFSTREMAAKAKAKGYKGLIVKNVYDNGGHWKPYMGDETSNLYIFFDSEKVKSADTVTYDDDGKVIPLSERFNESNKDIRWSVTESIDNDYLDAVANNDIKTAERLVEQAARNAGYDSPKLYHGTKAFGFTKIKTEGVEDGMAWSPFFATESIEMAHSYSNSYGERQVSQKENLDEDAENAKDIARSNLNRVAYKTAEKLSALYGQRNQFDAEYIGDSLLNIVNDGVARKESLEDIDNSIYEWFSENVTDLFYESYSEYSDEDIDFDEWADSEDAAEMWDLIGTLENAYTNLAGQLLGKTRMPQIGNYQFYAKTEGLLDFDADGANWNKLNIPGVPYSTTREVAKWAYKQGAQGVIIRNVFDYGAERTGWEATPETIYIFFHPESQVKSADPVTYDDNGNVIPLSERFNAKNEDIRWSLSEEVDSDGSETQTYAELTRELDKLKARNEKLAHEFVKTHGKEVDRRSAMKLLNEIVEKYQGTIKAKDLLAKFEDAFAYVNTKGATVDELMTKLNGIATEIFDSAIEYDDSYKEYGELLSDLRTTGITVAEQDRGGDFDDVGGWNEFRKKNFGSIKFVNDGKVMIDSKYQELATKYPEWFDDGITNPAEQAKEIASVARKLRELGMTPKDVYDGVDGQIVVNGIMGDLYSALKDADKKQTFADKAAKNVADVRLAEQMHYGAKVAEAERKADDTHMLDEMYFRRKISEIKRRAEKRERYITEHYAENLDKFRESKHKQYQEKLLRSRVKDLAKRAVQPTKTKHIPEDMKGDVLKFLQKLNWASDNIGHSKYAAEMRGLLSKAPKEFTKGNDIDGVNTFSEELLQDMSDFFSDKTVEEMTSDELYELNVILMRMIHEINYQDKLFHSTESASALASKAITQFTTARKERAFENAGTKLIDFIKYGAADPESFFHSLGVPVLTEAYQNLAKQQDVFARTLRELTGRMKEIVNGSIPKSWREDYKEYTLANGQKILLTPVQRMSLYLLSKQEASRKRLLSERGGIVPTATKREIVWKQQGADGKDKVKVSVPKTTLGKRVYLTEGDLITLEGTLTKEQIDIANKISELLNGRCAELGNEVSLAEEGYRKFIVENYFPMMVAETGKTFEQLANSAKEQIAHKSFTKDRTGTAGVPLVVDDIFNVMDRHVLGMSQYYAYDKALRDFQRVWKLRPEGKDNLNLTLDQHFGNGKSNRVSNFVQNFIKDVQGAQMQVGEETLLSEKFLSTYKAAQVAGNLSVVAKQPTAIFRAMPEFSAKGMAAMLNFATTKSDIKEMIENSGLAQLKDWGFSENTTAKSVAELYDDNATNWRGKLDDIFSWGAEKADMITWAAIWRASVADTKSLPEAIDKFNEVIRKTQVVKSAFTSSRITEQGGFAKLAFAFKNEPLKTFNYIRSTINDVVEGREGAKKKAFAVTVATAINTAVVAAISAGFSLIRDDEEDSKELFAEKFKENVIADLVSNSTIFLGDIWTAVESAMNGREVERMDLAVFTDATQFAQNFVDMFKKPESEQKNTWMKIVYDGARTVSNFTGIPIGNVIRAIKSVHGRVVELSDDPVARYNMTKIWYNVEGVDNASIRAKFRSILTEALDDGNYKAFAEINNDLRRHGFSASDIEKAVSNSARLYDAWNKGAETFRNEVNKAIKVAPMLSSTYVMEAFKSKKTALVNDLYDAMKSGSKKATSDAMSALLKHRDVDTKRVLTESDVDKLITKKIENAIKSEVKSKLADLYGTESYDAVKKKILNEYRHFEMITPEYIDKLARSLS